MPPQITTDEVLIHGHRVRFRTAGEGPLVVLVHGITGSSQTWEEVIPALAVDHTVVAPDMLGHGESAKPRGDYSLGAYASGLRDLLAVLGYDRGTLVGHSLGGGIAMVFAYQFPERTERLVLAGSGGLGRDVSIALRAAALPGSEYVVPLLASTPVLSVGAAASSCSKTPATSCIATTRSASSKSCASSSPRPSPPTSTRSVRASCCRPGRPRDDSPARAGHRRRHAGRVRPARHAGRADRRDRSRGRHQPGADLPPPLLTRGAVRHDDHALPRRTRAATQRGRRERAGARRAPARDHR